MPILSISTPLSMGVAICAAMDAVQSRFQIENDPDLIEGCIFELESLRAQYRYLLRVARQRGITCTEKTHLWGE